MDISRERLDKILEQLKGLKIKEAVNLRKRLQKELKSKPKKKRISKEKIKLLGNQKRSAKQKRYWRYVKLIRDNFPDLQTNEIRAQLKARRQGEQVKIQDAIWQNPSP